MVSGRLSQAIGVVTDWRVWSIVAVCAVGIGAIVLSSKRQVHVASLPSSLFRRHKTDSQPGDRGQGPIGGEVTRLREVPSAAPEGAPATIGRRPAPPLVDHANPNTPPLPPEPEIMIDLTALESEPAVGPAPRRHSVVDLRELEDAAPLPADPWG